ncbi:hypothetical protein TSUD_403290 [Trifolium subterraneum]|uniref:MADS-box domain-containing protein n=1 Tax=Trifolium subterraneum TaxID=3900 RepID=A0A2Z6PKX5_TRISU|nr:hypothetical protein TSUD_403290 [Trifolium subterraneum]
MGRGKVTLKYIQNEKDRKISFDHRMEGLTKKVSKFSNNFGVEPCLIVYNGDDKRSMTWPQDSTIVKKMLEKYEHQKFETAPKIFDVKDYFEYKKNIAEEEITRVRKKIAKKKYPTWSALFRVMGEEQINVCIGMVDAKIQACKQRINMLKNMPQSENISDSMKVNKHEEWVNQLIRLDEKIKELHKDYINGIVDVQQGETSFMLNTTQEKVISSHSSQPDVMHNIPETQHIPDDPIKQLNVDVPHVSPTNQIAELVVLEDFLMVEPEEELDPRLCGDILLEFEDLIGEPKDCDPKLDVPLVPSTKQLGAILEFDNLVAVAAKPKDGDTEVIDFNDNLNWVSQPEVFVKQGLSILSKNQQH